MVRIKDFLWDKDNIAHIIDKHGVNPEEVEEACFFNPLVRKTKKDRYFVFGQTQSGRYLTIIIENLGGGWIKVITARAMVISERRKYRKFRR